MSQETVRQVLQKSGRKMMIGLGLMEKSENKEQWLNFQYILEWAGLAIGVGKSIR